MRERKRARAPESEREDGEEGGAHGGEQRGGSATELRAVDGAAPATATDDVPAAARTADGSSSEDRQRKVRLQQQLFAEVAGDVKATDELQQRRQRRGSGDGNGAASGAGRGPAATPAAALQHLRGSGIDRRSAAAASSGGGSDAARGSAATMVEAVTAASTRQRRRRGSGAASGECERRGGALSDRSILNEGCDSTKFDDEMEVRFTSPNLVVI
ncbi:hypothetical protein Scep_026307 [Stephania cephalantha]|uniref:Uncharacterized protein n=1 Tax=Stephania cephalantha TaxID=152367 RepID=A0AAP0ES54_9MAGN